MKNDNVLCPECNIIPKLRAVHTVTGQNHWSYECNCHSQIRSDKQDAKDKYWLWHPSNKKQEYEMDKGY